MTRIKRGFKILTFGVLATACAIVGGIASARGGRNRKRGEDTARMRGERILLGLRRRKPNQRVAYARRNYDRERGGGYPTNT